MSAYTAFGAGTLTLGETPDDFSGEVLGASVTHEYTDVGDRRTMLDGTVRAPGQVRNDGFTASVENDLTAAGLYQFLMTNDGQSVPITFTPNTQGGAAWDGTVTCRLPASIGADEFGAPIVSDVELAGVGQFSFTPEA